MESQELIVMLDHIDTAQGAIFDKVDEVFASVYVHREIFSKLFAPNELIVTPQETLGPSLLRKC